MKGAQSCDVRNLICGLRVSELSLFKISDLFFEGGLLKLGRGNKQRFVLLGLAQKYIHIYKDIRIHLNVKKSMVMFFLNRGKSTYKSDDFTIIKDLAVKIELHKKLVHTFRHSFATHLLGQIRSIN
jgi:integrase/recombinase XerD